MAAGTKSSAAKEISETNGHPEPEKAPVSGEPEIPDPGPDKVDDERKTFTFHPKDGEPVEVHRVGEAIPYGRQRWFFWKLRKLQGLEQPIFWLEQAGIPEDLQERIMLLDDAEWARFFEEWMADGSGVSPGE